MLEHSVKVPRNYKIAATITKKVITEGGNLQSLLHDDKLKHFRINVIFALVAETIKRNEKLTELFKLTDLLTNEPRFDPWLAKVLTVELLFGKKQLPGQSKPETIITSYKNKFEECIQKISVNGEGPEEAQPVIKPRYLRVNTISLTTSDAIRQFQEEEYKYVRCTSGSYDEYLNQVKNLDEYEFMQDYHVKTVFVFPPKTKFYNHPFTIEKKIVLQDKATALAAHLLAPPPGSVVIDMCAAPGMKTTHLAAIMKNQGKVIAVEQNEERMKTLEMFVRETGSTCVEMVLSDVLKIKKGQYPDVEYVLLDPSCTGSGMDRVLQTKVDETRMAKISSLQEKLLKHAMHCFPKAKRIVYSTCSIYPEENERVIHNAVTANTRDTWRVQNCKELLNDQWNNFGSGVYGSMGVRCLYARSDTDLTIGFFLAVLERDFKRHVSKDGVEAKQDNEDNADVVKGETKITGVKKDAKEGNTKNLTVIQNTLDDNIEQANNVESKKKNKKRKTEVNEEEPEKKQYEENQNTLDENIDTQNAEEIKSKKKNKKRKTEVNEEAPEKKQYEENQNTLYESINTQNSEEIKSKKKHKKQKTEMNEKAPEKKQYEENQNTLDENIDTQNTEEIKSKKKNKKQKTEVNEEAPEKKQYEENQNTLDENIDTQNAEEIKSKKKNRKRKTEVNEEAPEKTQYEENQNTLDESINTQNSEEIKSKKKNKKQKTEMNEEAPEKKQYEENQNTLDENIDTQNAEEIKSKKKNRKRKTEVNEEAPKKRQYEENQNTLDENIDTQNAEEIKRKKKIKKTKTDVDEEEASEKKQYVENQNSLEENIDIQYETKAKKKNNKKLLK